MTIHENFIERLRRLDRSLRHLVTSRVFEFFLNPTGNGFHLEKLRGTRTPGLVSFRIDGSIRVIARHVASGFELIDFGPHDRIYRQAILM